MDNTQLVVAQVQGLHVGEIYGCQFCQIAPSHVETNEVHVVRQAV